MIKREDIKEYWNNQAIKFGTSHIATDPDSLSEHLEILNVQKYIQNHDYIADIGCGNGYFALSCTDRFNISVEGVDLSDEMIKVAKEAQLQLPYDKQQRISFRVGNVLHTNLKDNSFDKVVTKRCLINLLTRNEQAEAFKEIHRILKPGGLYLMCENTEQGLNKLNEIRKLANLDPIEIRWHNLYLDENKILDYIQGLFELIEINNFNSFYYLVSRIINARIAAEENSEPQYDSLINQIASEVSSFINMGNYSPTKLYVFKKL